MKKKERNNTAMINPVLCFNIEDDGWDNALSCPETLSENIMNTALDYMDGTGSLDFLPQDKTILIGLTLDNDENVRRLNKEFRNIDKPTNVLSFANIDDPDFAADCRTFDEVELGDIIIALETTSREAETKGITLHDHFCHLFIHGLLHLLGFDHQNDDEAEIMEQHEINILKRLGIANPYME